MCAPHNKPHHYYVVQDVNCPFKNSSTQKIYAAYIHIQTVLYLFDKQLENRRHFDCNFIHSEEQSPKRGETQILLSIVSKYQRLWVFLLYCYASFSTNFSKYNLSFLSHPFLAFCLNEISGDEHEI